MSVLEHTTSETSTPAAFVACLLLTALLFTPLASGTAVAATLFVHPDGSGDYPTVQAAVDAADDGDEIVLTGGIYRGPGNRNIVINENITVRSHDGNPYGSILDCEGDGTGRRAGFLLYNGAPLLQGISIRNADGDRGGGIACYSTPTLRDLVVAECRAVTGGGMYCEDFSAALVENCLFEDNFVYTLGGGVYCYYTDSTFRGCLFLRNEASGGGGGVVCGGNETFLDCLFASNRGNLYPSGLLCWAAVVTRCTFWNNGYGAIGGGPSTVIRNTIVAETDGPAIECTSGLTVECTNLFGNTGGDWVGCVEGREGTDGNFSADPFFCDPMGGDFRLNVGSPCLPGQHPDGADCDQIGAFGACSPTSVRFSSWGRIKHEFR